LIIEVVYAAFFVYIVASSRLMRYQYSFFFQSFLLQPLVAFSVRTNRTCLP